MIESKNLDDDDIDEIEGLNIIKLY
jgi:hypothetical protein